MVGTQQRNFQRRSRSRSSKAWDWTSIGMNRTGGKGYRSSGMLKVPWLEKLFDAAIRCRPGRRIVWARGYSKQTARVIDCRIC